MATSPAKFYFGFLIISIILWMIYILCSRLLTWMLGASVEFHVGGWKCLRDVVVKFETGAIESMSISEIRLSLRQFLINIRDPKMQVLICGLEVVVRSSTSTTNIQNFECQKSHTSGRGKWIVVANIARFFSVSVSDIVVKSPKVIVDIKKLKLDIDKDGGTNNLYVKLNVLPILVHLCESSIISDQSPNLSFERRSASQTSSTSVDISSAAFCCDEFSITSEFGHDREVGIVIRNVEVLSGDVILNLDEDSFHKTRQSSASVYSDKVRTSTTAASSAKKLHKEYSTSFPGKVFFSLRKLDVIYQEQDLLAENTIKGIQLKSVKSNFVGDTGESTRLDVDMKLSEIHLLKKPDEASVLKIMNVKVESFMDIPIQPNLPIRAEVDIKVGGTQCDLFISRLQPWLRLHRGNQEETHTLETSNITDMEIIMWRCIVSFPKMTIMLYDLDDMPMYHFCSHPTLASANNISSMDTAIHIELGELNLHLTDEPHTVSVLSHASEGRTRLKYSVFLEISQFSFSLNKDKQSIQLELKRAKSIYNEYKEAHNNPCSRVILFDMHNVKFVHRSGGLQESNDCSLFSATDISLGWDPDVHLSFYELFLRLRSSVYIQRPLEDETGCSNDISSVEDVDKQKRKESIFAIDVEMLTLLAKVRDGVEVKLEVESIFSENASTGVLFEGTMLGFNGSQVFKTTRIQISRIPTSSDEIPWDWIVQGLDLRVCLPYKLQLRVIADSIEEMLEGLSIITIAREENIFHGNRDSSKPKGPNPNFSRIRFCIRKLIADIEEEPMQGWLDEHYHLMKKEACELAARLKFLEDFIHKETSDPLAIKKAREEIQKRSFQSYYKACKDLIPSKGSSACWEGFQAGFKPSTSRTSLLSVCATNIDLSLAAVHGDDAGLMEVLEKLDPMCQEKDILLSRLNGSNICLNIGSLAVHLRNYTLPLLSVTSGICEGRFVQLRAQEADEERNRSSSQLPSSQDVYVGRWRKVKMFRSASGTTPSIKTYSDLRIRFEKGEVSFGVGYEPAFADISYAISLALGAPQVVEEEQSLPWWDNMRNNVHGNITLSFSESKWTVLATEDPYESQDKLQIMTGLIEFQHSDGRVLVNAKDFMIKLSSLESLISRHSLEVPFATSRAAFFEASVFNLEVTMDWECESENSLNVLDPFRSTSLSLFWNFSLASPIMTLGAHDIAWMLKFCGMNSNPPNKLRFFSRWPRFGVPRVAISEHLSLHQVMTEFMLRIDATPFIIKYMPWDSNGLSKGLTFNMAKLKYELCFSRGKQKYTSECKQDALELVYQGLDLHVLKTFINNEEHHFVTESVQHGDEGFLLSSDYLTVRRQASKADSGKLLAWQEAGRRNLEMTNVRSEFGNASESDENIQSDPSDDDGYNIVIADNCQRVFVYGLKLLWTIENRDVVRSFVSGISKAFEPPRPSPSRQYTQRKIFEKNQKESSSKMDSAKNFSSKKSSEGIGKVETNETEEEGTPHFMVNVIEPQFNLHSEEANGNFLLAAVSGRVLARSFHSIMRVGMEVIEHALGIGSTVQIPECFPEMTWTRMEYSIMLEHVQAHVAPTDLDPGAGLQWLPKISRNSPKIKRSPALLERVFMPCDMYLRYTRHKGGTPDLKVKPLKELTFNSHNITATMTSRQYQVMMDVLNNLLFARLPALRKSSLQYPIEDEDVEEEADEVVPYGVEEVELAKINLEEKEWEQKLLLDDIKKLSTCMDNTHMERKGELWMISSRISILVQELKKELLYAQKSRKAASASLRVALQKAAKLQLMEKEKNKSPPYAMSISLQINKIVWSMLLDGKSFAEAEIKDMIYDFDRDYKDIGVTRFTTKYFVVRNCLPNAKSDMFLSAWNPPPEWGKKCMLRVDSKHGAPKDGNYPLELFQVEIYPLRIHLTETMYTMMWEYFFPEEEHDLQRRQEVWKTKNVEASRVSSTATSVSTTLQSQNKDDRVQKSNTLNLKSSTNGLAQGLRRTSSFDMTWEETVAESVANELVLQSHPRTVSSSIEKQEDSSKEKLKETKPVKKSKPKNMKKFHNIKISQVELLITYEGSRLVVSDLKLLMDTYHRVEFTGTWGGLFTRVKKHIIWGVLKSFTGIQIKKFKDFQMRKLRGKSQINHESAFNDLDLSDDDEMEKPNQKQVTWFKRQRDGAGDRFVTSIRGLFNAQRRKAKTFVLRTMRGEAENDIHGEWSDSDDEFSPFSRQLTITKAKKLIRRHTKKILSTSQTGSTSQQKESLLSSPKETTAIESDSSSGSSPYEDFHG